MLLRLTLATGVAAIAALAQQNQFNPPPESSHLLGEGNHFLIEAVRGSRTDIELGQLAQQRATDPDVKKFAGQMVQSGNSTLESLKGIASSLGVAVPDLPSPSAVAQMQVMQQLSGARFDQAYMNFMIHHLKKEAGEMDGEIRQGKNPKLTGFAKASLPNVDKALKKAQQVEQKLNAGGSSSQAGG